MFRPDFLQSGDKVALVSPAGSIDAHYVDEASEVLRSWGLVPQVGKYTTAQDNYFAGTDKQRLEDMQWALNDDEIRAIVCTRGGYGSMRIMEQLDYSIFQGQPKWVVGFSDITVLHAKLNALGIESIHGAMPKSFGSTSPEAMMQLKNVLFGRIMPYHLPVHPFNREGVVQAELIGGNLCLVHCLHSSIMAHRFHRSILFIEDVGENLYAIDRMMQTLKLSGCLEQLQGLIVGAFSELKGDNFGKSAYEIVREAVDDYSFPTCFDFPAGHIRENFPLILGSNLELTVDETGADILYS